MKSQILFVGVDVDDNAFHATIMSEQGGTEGEFACKPTAGALAKKLGKFKKENHELRVCYEATYLGFSLYRELKDLGVHSTVISASQIPELPSDRIKTDRIDSRKLAEYFMKGLLTEVHVPDEFTESVRDSIRSRDFLVDKTSSVKTHILSQCRLFSLDYRKSMNKPGAQYWTQSHLAWLKESLKEHPCKHFKLNIELLLNTLTQLEGQVALYDEEIRKISQQKQFKEPVNALLAFRGIDVNSAMTLVTEIGDPKRFPHPRQLTSYAGMGISEYSSGGKEKRFSMTKMGNRHIRTTVIESAQYASRRPQVSRWLKQRRLGTPHIYTDITDRCMKRLYKKSTNLLYRGKVSNKVKVACAREMLGFIWEALMTVEKAS